MWAGQRGDSTPRGVGFPVRDPKSSKTLARVSIGSMRHSNQVRGYFRIGVLPLLVLEDVTLEVTDPTHLVEVLKSTSSGWSARVTGVPVQIQRLRIQWANEIDWQVTAGSCVVKAGEVWELSGGVRWNVGGRSGEAPKAFLGLSGPKAGRIWWKEGDGERSIYLGDSPVASQTPRITERP